MSEYTGQNDMSGTVTTAVNATAYAQYLAGAFVNGGNMTHHGGNGEADYSPVKNASDKANKAQQEMWSLLYGMATEIEALRATVVDLERNLTATFH